MRNAQDRKCKVVCVLDTFDAIIEVSQICAELLSQGEGLQCVVIQPVPQSHHHTLLKTTTQTLKKGLIASEDHTVIPNPHAGHSKMSE